MNTHTHTRLTIIILYICRILNVSLRILSLFLVCILILKLKINYNFHIFLWRSLRSFFEIKFDGPNLCVKETVVSYPSHLIRFSQLPIICAFWKLKTNTQIFQNSIKTRPSMVNTSSDIQFLVIFIFSFTCVLLFYPSIHLNLGH